MESSSFDFHFSPLKKNEAQEVISLSETVPSAKRIRDTSLLKSFNEAFPLKYELQAKIKTSAEVLFCTENKALAARVLPKLEEAGLKLKESNQYKTENLCFLYENFNYLQIYVTLDYSIEQFSEENFKNSDKRVTILFLKSNFYDKQTRLKLFLESNMKFIEFEEENEVIVYIGNCYKKLTDDSFIAERKQLNLRRLKNIKNKKVSFKYNKSGNKEEVYLGKLKQTFYKMACQIEGMSEIKAKKLVETYSNFKYLNDKIRENLLTNEMLEEISNITIGDHSYSKPFGIGLAKKIIDYFN